MEFIQADIPVAQFPLHITLGLKVLKNAVSYSHAMGIFWHEQR